MFYVIGLGLYDEKDITMRGLDAVKRSARVYLESYTSILMVQKEKLEEFYGRPVILADREMVELASDEILRDADKEDVSFLVVGDPFGATTHTDILLRARASRIPTRVIHNASIMNAVAACGLQLYNFGQTVSLVFFTDAWRPDSFYDRIRENAELGLHTLVLLDIKVKEQTVENLIRGRKIYEPPRYMSIPTAISQLLEVETARGAGVLSPKTTLAIALSRVGAAAQTDTDGGGGEQGGEKIVCGTLDELLSVSARKRNNNNNHDINEEGEEEDVFGGPLHSLVIVGKRLHPLEVEYAEAYALDRDSWRNVARTVYGCSLDE